MRCNGRVGARGGEERCGALVVALACGDSVDPTRATTRAPRHPSTSPCPYAFTYSLCCGKCKRPFLAPVALPVEAARGSVLAWRQIGLAEDIFDGRARALRVAQARAVTGGVAHGD